MIIKHLFRLRKTFFLSILIPILMTSGMGGAQIALSFGVSYALAQSQGNTYYASSIRKSGSNNGSNLQPFLSASRINISQNGTVYDCNGGTIAGVTVHANNVTVRNCRIIGALGTGIETHGTNNLFENITIESVSLSNGDVDGIRFFGSGHVFRNVVVKGIDCVSPAHCDGAQTWGDSNHDAANNILFDNVQIYNFQIYSTMKPQCFQIESGSPSSNIAHDITIQNSILNCYRAVNLGDSGDSGTTYNITVEHNTIIGKIPRPVSSIEEWGVFITKASNVIAKNNIFYNVDGEHLLGNINADYNLIYRSDNGRLYDPRHTHDLWGVNPLFVNPTNGDFRLQSNSPACTAGENGSYIGAYGCNGGVVPTNTTIPATATLPPTGTPVPTLTATPITPTLTAVPTNQPSNSPFLPGLAWEAEQGEITSPFTIANGYISQNILSSNPTAGGRALYLFSIQDAGEYMVKASVNASDAGSNSFFVGMDSEPDVSMIWDVVLTNGFEDRWVSWREGAAPDSNAANPKAFNLNEGEHTLIVRGRELDTLLDKLELVRITASSVPTITSIPLPTATQIPTTTQLPTTTQVPTLTSTSIPPTFTILPTNPSNNPPSLPGLSWEAEQGEISAPFTVANGAVSQNILSDNPTNGGRALYRFFIQDAGDYMVKAIVNAADAGSNSFFVGMDSEPDTLMIWDVILTNGFEEREVSWREGAAPETNSSNTKIFSLAAGEHTLIIRGREIGTLLDKVEISKILIAQPTIPAPPTATQIPTITPTNGVVHEPIPQPTTTPSYTATTVQLATQTLTYTQVPTAINTESAPEVPTLEPPTSAPTETSIPVLPTSTNTLVPPTNPPTETAVPATFTSTLVPPTATWMPSPVPTESTPTVTTELPPTKQPPSQPATETVYDDKDSAFVFSSDWQSVRNKQAYNRSYKETTSNGSFVTLGFTGQSFSVLYKTGKEYRTIDVYIDGTMVGSINERAWTQSYQKRWDYPSQLTPGVHTLKLVFATANQKNRTKGSIDAVIVR